MARKKSLKEDTPIEEPEDKVEPVEKDSKYPPGIRGYNLTTKRIWERAMKTNSRKTAIRAMCLMCVGGSAKFVTECTCKTCPLWKHRITG